MAIILRFVGLVLSIGAVIMGFFGMVYGIHFLAYIGLGINIAGLVLMGLANKKSRTKLGNIVFLAGFACLVAVVFFTGAAVALDGLFV
ncbi:MAG: hypothetical protein FWE03_04280 [Firmicutes bacterium]|nr:hypothetical protein [Bacillota bacterium]